MQTLVDPTIFVVGIVQWSCTEWNNMSGWIEPSIKWDIIMTEAIAWSPIGWQAQVLETTHEDNHYQVVNKSVNYQPTRSVIIVDQVTNVMHQYIKARRWRMQTTMSTSWCSPGLGTCDTASERTFGHHMSMLKLMFEYNRTGTSSHDKFECYNALHLESVLSWDLDVRLQGRCATLLSLCEPRLVVGWVTGE